MSKDDQLQAAQKIVGDDPIKAAGMFALQDNYAAITAGGVAGSMGAPNSAGILGGAVGNAMGMEAGRQANAEANGVSERMMLAVTDSAIHVLAMPMIGGVPERELMWFDRSRTDVKVKKFGLSRRVALTDQGSGRELHLQGSTAKFAVGGKGDKAVLDELRA
jgi:hypothetical protein